MDSHKRNLERKRISQLRRDFQGMYWLAHIGVTALQSESDKLRAGDVWLGEPACSPSFWASWSLEVAPRLIFIFCNSPFRRVLWRKIACFMGPSPAWIPRAKSKSCTRTKTKLGEVNLRSSFMRFAFSMTSLRTALTIKVFIRRNWKMWTPYISRSRWWPLLSAFCPSRGEL